MSSPSHDYYREMADRWRGRLVFEMKDASALGGLGLLDRMAWRMTGIQGRLFGPPWLETSVDIAGLDRNEVIHTTLLRQWGMPLAAGRERITLDPDGRRFTLRGAHRFAWAPWSARAVEGTGEIHADARGASYTFLYLGARMAQETKIDGRDLIVTQTTAFSRSEVRLVRR